MHETPCETLVKCKEETSDRLDSLEEKVETISVNVQAMREILDTWNNTKGFVSTVRIMSKVLVWTVATGAALTAIYHAIKHFGQS